MVSISVYLMVKIPTLLVKLKPSKPVAAIKEHSTTVLVYSCIAIGHAVRCVEGHDMITSTNETYYNYRS